MSITPVCGRDPYASQWVAVYKNLNRGAWSIRAQDGPHKGKVVGHADAVSIVDCTMHVGRAAQARIAAGQPRQVHAWIIGRLSPGTLDAPRRLVYRPPRAPRVLPRRLRRNGLACPGGRLQRRRIHLTHSLIDRSSNAIQRCSRAIQASGRLPIAHHLQ
ncbi:hypothetical protein PJK47_21000 [Mycobacterium kansasii]